MRENWPMTEAGWAGLFKAAFTQSRNPMLLADEARRIVEVNGAFLHAVGARAGYHVNFAPFTYRKGSKTQILYTKRRD